MTRRAPLVVIGDTLLDRDLEGRAERLSPDAPVPVVSDLESTARAGGAGLAAVLAARDGRDVTLVTALAQDTCGRELRALLDHEHVTVVDLGLTDGATPEKVRVRAGGTSIVRLDRGGPTGTPGAATLDARLAIARARAVLVSDYGRGVAAEPKLRHALEQLSAEIPVVWDPHPRGPAPTTGATLVTPNRSEAERFAGPAVTGDTLTAIATRAQHLARTWSAVYVAVTLGARGALVGSDTEGPPLVVPAPGVAHGDPCGAGDRFASAAAGALADGRLPSEAVALAVEAASRFVADGGAAAHARTHREDVEPRPADVHALLDRVRRRGGTVVATGGCFDLLHAGHVRLLQRARTLGDCLVVCLNDDASVRRLKGADRPLTPQADRAEVLGALDCVDAVVPFGEDTPERLLDELRPDIWCKGGDYAVEDLPEAPLVASWGGQAVVLPFLPGRSTTGIVTRARSAR